MCDSKKDVEKESESNFTSTSPLIIRLCNKMSNTSPVDSSVDIRIKETSKFKKLVADDHSIKSEAELNAKTLKIDNTNENQPVSNEFFHPIKNLKDDNLSVLEKSNIVNEVKVIDCTDVTKSNESSISNKLEGRAPKQKRRKVVQNFLEKSSELPLVMQSSNLHSDSGLDFGHDRGGTSTTNSSKEVEQHFIHDDNVPKLFNLKQTLEKEKADITAKFKCPEKVLKAEALKYSHKRMQKNENSNNTDAKKIKNYETDITLSTLSCNKELHGITDQDKKTTIAPEIHLAFATKKDKSLHKVDNTSTSQSSSSHSLVLNAANKTNLPKAAELNEVCPRKRKNSRNESSQSGDIFSCPFKQFRKEKLEISNMSCQSANETSLSFDDGIDIDNDTVGYLEISELEKIRESLKKQLSQNDSSESPTYSEKLCEEKIKKDSMSDESNEQSINDKSSSNYKSNNINKIDENYFEQKQCLVPKINDQHTVVTSEKNSLPLCCYTEKNKTEIINEFTSVADTPPLVMQSSNLLLNDGLDNKHGGGGKETSVLKLDVKQEPCLDSNDSKDKDSIIHNDSKATDKETFINGKAVESDDSASNTAGNSHNNVQNRLMEFDILDEFESDDNDGDEDNSDDSDISTDEIDAMLEEGLMQRKPTDGTSKESEHEEKEKVILKVRGKDHFDVLPEGWIEVTHNSGMPIYLHKQSRVCSVSKPYFLGPGSTRKHEIPVSAIPCLHYLRELEKEKAQEEKKEETQADEKEANGNSVSDTSNENSSETKNSLALNEDENKAAISEKANANKAANGIFLAAKLETVKDTKESGSLNYLDVREYCKKRFEFQTITVKRFRTWSGRRRHQKQIKRKQRPFLPDNTKLITCPLLPSDKASATGNNTKREFIMNPSGKSPVCILHEYVQHTLRVQPKYIFKELESASTPYGAIVLIDNVEYGYGFGSSKKLAKSDAAKAALEILIPKMKMFSPDKNDNEAQNVDFFDQVRVEDPRVCELSVKAGQPYPYQILLECLKRNYGMGDTEIQFMMKNLKHQKNEFYMRVGKHEISVVCKNKRDGKHRASQAILQKLHPHINSWGSLLRMYGKGSHKTMKEKKEEEQRITELQSQACVNKPNMSILNKLKEEMLKYREKVKSMKPIGKLIPERMECFSTSSSNLKNVEL
ncbi:uncharacterized protein LOC129971462 [Argiope bruennichi]|uniref:Microprocessor complex subunit DGCR8 like protein n=1 Tax=Argiope bruennichi TaxID=94029 RepID=A0A8T0F7N8_ARGBR|nr:uncharacterized protein LOC129971462 [Argiope bruennichi]KAF8787187.1 Microprocessor complex subunit DGCR8 like protein [Argiope bruennichi]